MNSLEASNFNNNFKTNLMITTEKLDVFSDAVENFASGTGNDIGKQLNNIANNHDNPFNSLIKQFLDKNKELIINYYLFSENNDLTSEEKQILVFLKTAWLNFKQNSKEEKIKIPGLSSSEEDDNTQSINYLQQSPHKKKTSKRGRNGKEITLCPHVDRKHYAKNMCYNCYHSKGREKTAWKCEHNHKTHYAKGLCQNCYHCLYKEEKPEIVKKASDNARKKKKLKIKSDE